MDQGTFTPRHAVLGGVGSYPAWDSIGGGGGEYGSGHFHPCGTGFIWEEGPSIRPGIAGHAAMTIL